MTIIFIDYRDQSNELIAIMNDQSLDIVLLRSFLAVAETLHFTAAARRRGLSQSTISQHVSRLEHAVGRTLLLRDTKNVALTPDGEDLSHLAHDIVAANDRAINHFDRTVMRGRLRFGVSEDLVLSRLPEILRGFRRDHPMVDLDMTVGLSSVLYEKLDTGKLDLLFAKRQHGDERGRTLWRERLTWLGSRAAAPAPDQPVPLVVFPGSSITRSAAIDALNAANRAWRVAFSSDSLVALMGAVRSGFGITAQSSLLSGLDLEIVTEAAALPGLPEVTFVVLGRGMHLEGPAAALAKAIMVDTELRNSRLEFRRLAIRLLSE